MFITKTPTKLFSDISDTLADCSLWNIEQLYYGSQKLRLHSVVMNIGCNGSYEYDNTDLRHAEKRSIPTINKTMKTVVHLVSDKAAAILLFWFSASETYWKLISELTKQFNPIFKNVYDVLSVNNDDSVEYVDTIWSSQLERYNRFHPIVMFIELRFFGLRFMYSYILPARHIFKLGYGFKLDVVFSYEIFHEQNWRSEYSDPARNPRVSETSTQRQYIDNVGSYGQTDIATTQTITSSQTEYIHTTAANRKNE